MDDLDEGTQPPIGQRLHDLRRRSVLDRFQKAVAAQKNLKLYTTHGEERAQWEAISHDIFFSIFDACDPLADPRLPQERDPAEQEFMQQRLVSHQTYHMNDMLRYGLCDTKDEARTELEAIEQLAQQVTQKVHADDKQRADLRGRKPEPGKPSRRKGRFIKAFQPEDAAMGSFREMLLHANSNAPAMKAWAEACEREMKHFWISNVPYNNVRLLKPSDELPDPVAMHWRVYEHLAPQFLLPLMDGPSPQVIEKLSKPENNKEEVLRRVQGSSHYDDVVSVMLLNIAATEMQRQAQQSIEQYIWNADKVGGTNVWTPRSQALMEGALKTSGEHLYATLMPAAQGELRSEAAYQQFQADMLQILGSTRSAAMRFAREGAGLKHGRGV